MTDVLTEITPISDAERRKLAKLFKPLNETVIVALDATEGKTPGGILLPESTLQQMTAKSGTIVAHGPGARSPVTGERVPLSVEVGDRVIFGQYAGSDLQYGDLKLKAMREPDCLTRVSDELALQPKSVQLKKGGKKRTTKKKTSRKLVRAKPFCPLPRRREPLYAGADGWDAGAGIQWLWWLLITRTPENEL